jgi:hypothetical protein
MSNVSDHHPIQMSVMFELKSKSEKVNGTLNTNTRIKWDKVDLYKAMVGEVSDLPTDTTCNIGDITNLQNLKTQLPKHAVVIGKGTAPNPN